MTLLRIALFCAAMIGLLSMPAARAEDQPPPPVSADGNNEAATVQPLHCDGQNCLPPADDPVEECKGQDCALAPQIEQTPPGPQILHVH